MGHEFISDVLRPLAIFGGIGLMVWLSVAASVKARLEHGKLHGRLDQPQETQPSLAEDRVLAQLQALRAEVAQLRDTSTQFDLSLEHAVQRLEERVSRGEAKSAPSQPQTAAEEPQRLGLR